MDEDTREAEWVVAGLTGERPKTMYEAFDALDAAFADLGRTLVRQYRQDARAVWGVMRRLTRCARCMNGRGRGSWWPREKNRGRGVSEPMEWTVTTHAMPYMMTMLAREHGTLHVVYDLPSDAWTVTNDAGYAASRLRGVEALRDALAEFDDGKGGGT